MKNTLKYFVVGGVMPFFLSVHGLLGMELQPYSEEKTASSFYYPKEDPLKEDTESKGPSPCSIILGLLEITPPLVLEFIEAASEKPAFNFAICQMISRLEEKGLRELWDLTCTSPTKNLKNRVRQHIGSYYEGKSYKLFNPSAPMDLMGGKNKSVCWSHKFSPGIKRKNRKKEVEKILHDFCLQDIKGNVNLESLIFQDTFLVSREQDLYPDFCQGIVSSVSKNCDTLKHISLRNLKDAQFLKNLLDVLLPKTTLVSLELSIEDETQAREMTSALMEFLKKSSTLRICTLKIPSSITMNPLGIENPNYMKFFRARNQSFLDQEREKIEAILLSHPSLEIFNLQREQAMVAFSDLSKRSASFDSSLLPQIIMVII